eukprot:COSAG02_NODE_8747_length_2457_cov_0.967769_1_plen_26_part_10
MESKTRRLVPKHRDCFPDQLKRWTQN